MTEKDYNYYKNLLEKENFQEKIDNLANKYSSCNNIVIYGAGLLSTVIFDNYDLSKLNITCITDLKFFVYDDIKEFKGYKAISPFDINFNDYDLILVTVVDFIKTKDFIKKGLFINNESINIDTFCLTGK